MNPHPAPHAVFPERPVSACGAPSSPGLAAAGSTLRVCTVLGVAALFGTAWAAEPAPPAPPPAQPLPAAAGVKHVDAAGAARLLAEAEKNPQKPSILVLDVRTPEEFAEGHLKGAKNEDIAGSGFSAKLEALDKSRTYLVHCAAGGRSTRALSLMKKQGFKSILHLDGGLNAWKEAGLPVEKEKPAPPR